MDKTDDAFGVAQISRAIEENFSLHQQISGDQSKASGAESFNSKTGDFHHKADLEKESFEQVQSLDKHLANMSRCGKVGQARESYVNSSHPSPT